MTTITSNIETLVEGHYPDRAELWVTAPSIKVNDEVRSGGLVKVPYINGRLAFELLSTDTPDTDPVSWVYGFQIRWRGGSLPKFYAEVYGDTIDLDTLVHVDPATPEYLPSIISIEKVVGLESALEGISDAQNSLVAALETKADQLDLETVQEDFDALQMVVNGKASQASADSAYQTADTAYQTAAYVYQLILGLTARVDALEQQ